MTDVHSTGESIRLEEMARSAALLLEIIRLYSEGEESKTAMTLAYFDCFSGISGDMTLGALVDLGVPVEWLEAQLRALPLDDFDLRSKPVSRHGISAVQVEVISRESHHHRDYRHIQALIASSPLSDKVKAHSLAIFERIATAEARIHGCDKETVHFHEVGGVDAIVDIVGACLGMAWLGIDAVAASALPSGGGFVKCAHGVLPVPAPATLEILKGVPLYGNGIEKELVTPNRGGHSRGQHGFVRSDAGHGDPADRIRRGERWSWSVSPTCCGWFWARRRVNGKSTAPSAWFWWKPTSTT